MSYKIITGANDSYILTLLNFIKYHIQIGINLENIIVYDLGLNENNLQSVKNILQDKTEIKKLNFEEYPEHVDLKKYNGLNCSYAFKPIIIYNEANIYNNIPIIWLDCACKITIVQFNKMIQTIKINGFYCPVGNLEKTIETIELNHPQTLNLIGINRYQHFNELQTRLACICGVNYNTLGGKRILDDWYKHSLNKDVIMPDGSSRNNHRQDQTVLSALMFLYEKENNILFEKSQFDISCWNKLDKNFVDNNYNKYALVQKNNGIQLAIIYANTIDEAIKIYCDRKQTHINIFIQHYNVVQR
jgi:hypothetical protein